MPSKRPLVFVIVLALIVLLALGGFALWLFGRPGSDAESDGRGAADSGIVSVRVIDAYDGARVLTPVGIGSGSNGGFFVTLRDVARVVEFDREGDFVRAWGERGLGAGQMMVPLGVAVDRAGGRVYVTDRSRLRLICYDLEGTLRWEVPVLNPLTPAVTPDGVAVSTFGPIALLDAEGVVQGEYGSRGELPGQFDYPRGIAIADDGTAAFIADSNNARVQRIRFSGETTATVDWVLGRPPLNQDDASTLFGIPASVTTDDEGHLYVLDGFRAEVTVLDPLSGAELHRFEFPTGTAAGQVYMPSGIAFLSGDTFAITDTANDRIQIFRLLLPERNTVIARSPWLIYLLPLLLLPALLWFGRKRWFVTKETLERAAGEGRLRLLAAVLKRMYVLPEVYEMYRDVQEDGVALDGYLQALDRPSDRTGTAEETLAHLARRATMQKLLLARHKIVCADPAQCERLADRGSRVRGYDELVSEYVLEDEESGE